MHQKFFHDSDGDPGKTLLCMCRAGTALAVHIMPGAHVAAWIIMCGYHASIASKPGEPWRCGGLVVVSTCIHATLPYPQVQYMYAIEFDIDG